MAEPIFALHGWGLNAAVFDALCGRFTDREFIARDLPGHGKREHETLGRNIDNVAKRLLANAPERAVWLGWSLGGTLSLAAALAMPERVSALVIVAASASFVARPGWPQGMPAERMEKMAWELAGDPEKTVSDFLTLQVRASAAGRAVLRDLRRVLSERGMADTQALADGLALLETMDYRSELSRIKQPVLVIAGGRDRLVQPAAAQALAEVLPNAQFLLMKQSAHAPFLSHRDDFCAQVNEFLRCTK